MADLSREMDEQKIVFKGIGRLSGEKNWEQLHFTQQENVGIQEKSNKVRKRNSTWSI